jgi:hypothetical protein
MLLQPCMAIFVFCWIGFSLLLCLALLRAAARPRPEPELLTRMPRLSRVEPGSIPSTLTRTEPLVREVSRPAAFVSR